MSHKSLIGRVDRLLVDAGLNDIAKSNDLNKCLNESWFSDSLAWLLNPKGSHGLGVDFIKAFVRRIAINRSDSAEGYKRRKTLLRANDQGKGVLASSLGLKNAGVVRELYLGQEGRCDIAILDLDHKDRLVVAIENKLFGENSDKQLERYYTSIKDKFSAAKIREYVYLTLNGSKPRYHEKEKNQLHDYWVRLSWCGDVLGIVKDLSAKKTIQSKQLSELVEVLEWLNKLLEYSRQEEYSSMFGHLKEKVVNAAEECLLYELNRRSSGKWERKGGQDGQSAYTLVFAADSSSSRQTLDKRRVKIKVESDLSIEMEATKIGPNNKILGESKIVIPAGLNADQFFNMIDFDVPEILDRVSTDKAVAKNDSKRLTVSRSEVKNKYCDLFDFVCNNYQPIRAFSRMANYVK